MKKIIYKTDYTKFYRIENTSIAYMIWTSKTLHMTTAEFKHEVEKRLDTCKELNLNKLLADDIEFAFTIMPKLQDWVAEAFKKISILKHAMILPDEIFVQVGIEQTLEEIETIDMKYQKQFFNNIDKAIKWLIK